MNEIRLVKLTFRYFKGIQDFALEVNGQNASVFGDNGSGKTTLFDGWYYLLFDKDSQNKKDFEIKTLDENGEAIHGLQHEVEGTLEVNGKRITLRKVYAEKWQKKRGSATQEFTGHTTDYFVNDVPVKQKEYKEQIDSIISEDAFKLLTNPTYFNEVLKWQDRRSLLLEVCGDVTDEEVIGNDPDLKKLPGILDGRTVDAHRTMVKAKQAKINEELKKIPVRIDEANRSKPDTDGLTEKEIVSKIDGLQLLLEAKVKKLAGMNNGGEIAEKEKQLRVIQGEMLQIKNDVQEGTLEKVTAKRGEISQIKSDIEDAKYRVSRAKNSIIHNNDVIERKKSETDRLRQEWHKVNNETFEHHHDNNCYACGRELPQEQIQEAHEKALADFNRKKAERLEEINAQGKAAADENTRLEKENAGFEAEIISLEQYISAKELALQVVENELSNLLASVKNVEDDLAYIAKKRELGEVQEEINQLRESTQEAAQKVKEEISEIKAEILALEQDKAKFAQVETLKQRIEDLKQQEKSLAAEYAQLEQELFLTEEFIRSKVNLLESKINSKFKFARFKLFEQQINGGLAEVCETTFNGVPYSSGLNNAARINVGLDIINTLSEHYGFTAPIFVDNAEAVTRLTKTKGQQIKLVVPPSFENLPEEMQEKLMSEEIAANPSLTKDQAYDVAKFTWEEGNKKLRVEKVKDRVTQ